MPINGHRTAVKVDLNEEAYNQPALHNRWHPDIPTAAKVKQGEVVNIEWYSEFHIRELLALTSAVSIGLVARFRTMILQKTSRTSTLHESTIYLGQLKSRVQCPAMCFA